MVRETVAVVTTSEAVDGSKQRKAPRQHHRSSSVATVTVRADVMAAARSAQRPGERIVPVSETEVMLLPEVKP